MWRFGGWWRFGGGLEVVGGLEVGGGLEVCWRFAGCLVWRLVLRGLSRFFGFGLAA